jgi:hypothetical protein
MAKCPICKEMIIGYEWTKTKSGKKWLANSDGKWHDCPKSTSKFSKTSDKWITLKAIDHEFCNMCDSWLITFNAKKKYPQLHYISMEDHIKTFHPNDEILDEIDMKPISEEQKEKFRISWNKPKRTTIYVLNNLKCI